MYSASRQRRGFIRGIALLAAFATQTFVHGTVIDRPSKDPNIWLQEADNARTSNHQKFIELLKKIDGKTSELSAEQRLYWRYLTAWEVAYKSNDDKAIPLLDAIAAESGDENLRFRASASVVNILANLSRFQEAFSRMSVLIPQLTQVTDKNTLAQGLSNAAILYEDAGQYDLALNYAGRLLKVDAPDPGYACKGHYYESAALYKSGKLLGIKKKFTEGIAACISAGDDLFANGIRVYMADLYNQEGHPDSAVNILQENYKNVVRSGYSSLLAQFDVSLAEAYWGKGDIKLAYKYANAAVGATTKNSFTESLTSAYRILYQIEQKAGNPYLALAYHEKYMANDKGYLDQISARSIAFQVVNQQVLAKKLQVDALSKQNEILKLQQSLGIKAAETSRLYIILLLTILASIAYWAYRLKRSQMRFMKLARRDGLTGIYNRQHFVASAERQLQYCEKSGRVAGLIVIDLDHFKIVNDTHGHAVGDHILKRAVAACEAHLRSTDVFGRLGGEEFGILMPECDKHIAAGRADLIRMAIASVSDSEEAAGVVVSASFGVSSTTQSGYNLRQLLIHADKALYAAKRSGRNRVELFTDSGMGAKAAFEALPLDPRS